MLVKYCGAKCQRNHWPTHKKDCKRRAAQLRDEALFKDPPAKEDCPICFLPMPEKLLSCMGACTPSVSLDKLGNVLTAKQREWIKQMEKKLGK